jgi:hypothetical protein
MSDIKQVNQINFDYNGKHYCLEYTRDTVKQMEGAGFVLADMGDRPATRIEQLWAGAFLANHRKTSNTVIKELYGKMKDKETLLTKLSEMYQNTLNYLLPDADDDDEGNVEWTATI